MLDLSRLKAIIGERGLKKLDSSTVAVSGLGGVGSYAATSLARSGIGHLILVDFDVVEESNINRQEFALQSTIGKKKVDVAASILKDINPDIKLTLFSEKVIPEMCEEADFIIDAIDDIPAKIEIAKTFDNLISCMGTAQRIHPEMLEFGDIYSTKVCPLCRAFRKEARKVGIEKLQVVYSTETPINLETRFKAETSNNAKVSTKSQVLGSTSFVPPVAGFMLASYAVRKLIEN